MYEVNFAKAGALAWLWVVESIPDRFEDGRKGSDYISQLQVS